MPQEEMIAQARAHGPGFFASKEGLSRCMQPMHQPQTDTASERGAPITPCGCCL